MILKKFLNSPEVERVFYSIKNIGMRDSVYLFFSELTPLMKAGVPVIEAVESIQEGTSSKRLKKSLTKVSQSIAEGVTLSKALEEEQLLNPRIATLLDIGEKSGNLIENLETIVLQNEKETSFRSAIRSSLLYVVIVLTLALGVGIATPWIILPQLATFFNTFQADLPLVTRILIGVGEFLSNYGIFVFPIFAVMLIIIVYFLFSFPKTRFIGHSILFHLPISSKLIKEAELARFTYLLGTQLQSGISILEALRVMPTTTTYKNYEIFYSELENRISEGFSFSEAIINIKGSKSFLPSSVIQLIRAGERSGTLSEMLIKIGEKYEERVQQTAKTIPTILEPILLVLVGGLVATIALGVVLPIYNLSEIIQ